MDNENVLCAEEPMMVNPMTSYADVMRYLHSIRITPQVKESVGRRLLLEATEPDLAKAFARLDDLSQLKADWDGRGAKKISYYVLNNLRNVLLISENDDWKNWMISPDTNGALGLQSKRGIATISVGDKEFSYYSETSMGEVWKSHVAFSPEVFLNVMRKIA